MEVGIEDCLHIDFEYNKSKYILNQYKYKIIITIKYFFLFLFFFLFFDFINFEFFFKMKYLLLLLSLLLLLLLLLFYNYRYHLKDVIVGKIFFSLVRIKIKHMELSIIRRETTGARKYNIYIHFFFFK